MKANFWIFETFRPNLRIIDSLRNAKVKRLYEAVENDTIEDQPEARKHDRKHVSYLSLDHSPKEIKEMTIGVADADGVITTDNPVEAFLIQEDLRKLLPINHPWTKQPVVFELSKHSAPLPKSLAEAEKMLKKA